MSEPLMTPFEKFLSKLSETQKPFLRNQVMATERIPKLLKGEVVVGVIVTTLCPLPYRSSGNSVSDPASPVRVQPPGHVRGDHHITPLLSHGGLH